MRQPRFNLDKYIWQPHAKDCQCVVCWVHQVCNAALEPVQKELEI